MVVPINLEFRIDRRSSMLTDTDFNKDRREQNYLQDKLIDSNRCEHLLESLEKYSKKLDKLLEKTSILEKTSLKD